MTFARRVRTATLVAGALVSARPLLAQQVCSQPWSTEPDLTYPAVDAAPLSGVQSLALGTTGRLAVLEFDSPSAVLYGANGRFLRVVGRAGAGPGEFREISHLQFLGDSLWAVDTHLLRGTLLRPDGTVARTVPFNRLSGSFGATYRVGQGYVVLTSILLTQPGAGTRLLSLDAAGTVRDSIIPSLRFDAVRMMAAPGGPQFFMRLPTPAVDQAAAFPDGSGLVIARGRVADDGRRSVLVTGLGPSLDTAFTRRIAVDPAPVSRAFVDAAIDTLARRYARYFPSRDAAADAVHEIWHPARHFWPVQGLLVGADGRIWIRTTPASNRWTVLSSAGARLGCVDAPADVNILAADEAHLYGARKDSLDVPAVVRLRIRKHS